MPVSMDLFSTKDRHEKTWQFQAWHTNQLLTKEQQKKTSVALDDVGFGWDF